MWQSHTYQVPLVTLVLATLTVDAKVWKTQHLCVLLTAILGKAFSAAWEG